MPRLYPLLDGPIELPDQVMGEFDPQHPDRIWAAEVLQYAFYRGYEPQRPQRRAGHAGSVSEDED